MLQGGEASCIAEGNSAPITSTLEEDCRTSQLMITQINSVVEQMEKGMFADNQNRLKKLIGNARALVFSAQGKLSSSGRVSAVSTGNTTGRKLELMLAEIEQLERAGERMLRKFERSAKAAADRELLLASAASSSASKKDDLDDVATLSKEENGLRHSRNRIRQLVEESDAVMGALQGQFSRMDRANTNLGSMLESLGVSNHTLLQIARRNRVDSAVVYGGIVLLLMLMVYIWMG